MSPRLPRLTASQLERAIGRAGWLFKRQTGSHAHYCHPDRPGIITVPRHSGKTLPDFVVQEAIKTMGMSSEAFRELL